MDVDKIAFPSRLLEILEALSEAHFVSVDFEFSGVSSKPPGRQKQTIEERYKETKEAAEKYQILQVGLTCAQQDPQTQRYILRPFNIPLCATFDEDLDIERQFSFQSSAVEFLLRNNFNFNVSFEDGVPYLSRVEEIRAKAKFKDRDNKNRFGNIDIKDDDTLTHAFLSKLRNEIIEWNRSGDDEGVEILSRTVHWRDANPDGDLTAYDKRLIHQTVRNEYPWLVTISRHRSIIIKRLDEDRENEIRKEKYRRYRRKIYNQIGFRWVIDAMTAKPLGKIDISWFARHPETGQPRIYDLDAYKARFDRAADSLRWRKPVLVGHNCFTDLIYLYRTFIDDLPPTVDEFVEVIHAQFPMVVDTKYLFTHNCGNLNPASSLESIEEALRSQELPRMETGKGHGKYEDDEYYHEAGYDSYLTARVAILLSAKLEAAGTYIDDGELKRTTPTQQAVSPPSTPGRPQWDRKSPMKSPASPQGSPWATPEANTYQTSPKNMATPPRSRFATGTLYDALTSTSFPGGQPSGVHTEVVGSSFALNPTVRPFPIAAAADGATNIQPQTPRKARAKTSDGSAQLDHLMPPWRSDFWSVYGNKLRVFGTVEGLLDLNPKRGQAE